MPKIFSFASWNVEHFHGDPARQARVGALLQSKNPDVFALYEVTGKDVFRVLMDQMLDHRFFICENTRSDDMEILIGVHKRIQAFITQREEFRGKVPTLRPGALATLVINNDVYTLLFLHVKSATDPRSWGLRDDMFARAAKLKGKLDSLAGAGNDANFICTGDWNTMGLDAPFNNISDIDGLQELDFLSKRFDRRSMRRLPKNYNYTWWNGKDNWNYSDLDHVFASNHLNFKQDPNGNEIEVVGWPQKTTKPAKKTWINQYSDHALLYGEVVS